MDNLEKLAKELYEKAQSRDVVRGSVSWHDASELAKEDWTCIATKAIELSAVVINKGVKASIGEIVISGELASFLISDDAKVSVSGSTAKAKVNLLDPNGFEASKKYIEALIEIRDLVNK